MEKSKFFSEIARRNQNISEICLKKRNFLVKLPEKIEIFRKFAWKNRIFLPRPPDFKPD